MTDRKPPRKLPAKTTPAAPPTIDEIASGVASAKADAPMPAPQTVDFDALEELTHLALGRTPRDAASHGDEGEPFVRMVNLSGHPIAVSMKLVLDRLMDGYHFIDNEPAVPIKQLAPGQHQDVPEALSRNPGSGVRVRPMVTPKNLDEARVVWFDAMRTDLAKMRGRTDLHWEFMRQLGNTIVARTTGT